MYKKTYYIFITLTICLLCSCTFEKEEDKPLSFKKEQNINFEDVYYPNLLGLTMQIIPVDSLLLINDFYGDTLINVYNIRERVIEKKLITVGNGPEELQSPLDLQIDKEQLYFYCRPRFSLYKSSLKDINEKDFKIHKIGQMPPKGDRFLPLSDSLFLFSGLWNKRYAIIDASKNNEIREFGNYPDYWKEEANIPNDAKAMFHQVSFLKHPTKQLFVSCSKYILEIYSYDSKGKELPTLLFKKKLGKYSYKYQSGDLVTVNENEGSDPKVITSACSSKYIYLVIEAGEKREKCNIMVLDWNGDPIQLLKSDKKISSIAIDEKSNKAYCSVETPEDKLVSFNLMD